MLIGPLCAGCDLIGWRTDEQTHMFVLIGCFLGVGWKEGSGRSLFIKFGNHGNDDARGTVFLGGFTVL